MMIKQKIDPQIQLQNKIKQCKQLCIQYTDKSLQGPIIKKYLSDNLLLNLLDEQYIHNRKGDYIRLYFKQPQNAMHFYKEANFRDKFLIRPFNIYLNMTLTPSQMKRYYFDGITQQNIRYFFQIISKIGVCKIYMQYIDQIKFKTDGMVSFSRVSEVPIQLQSEIVQELQTKGIYFGKQKHKRQIIPKKYYHQIQLPKKEPIIQYQLPRIPKKQQNQKQQQQSRFKINQMEKLNQIIKDKQRLIQKSEKNPKVVKRLLFEPLSYFIKNQLHLTQFEASTKANNMLMTDTVEEIIDYIEEQMLIIKNQQNKDQVIRYQEKREEKQEQKVQKKADDKIKKDKQQKIQKDLQQKIKQYQASIICAICLDQPKNCMNEVCNHVSCCMDCAKTCKECPICRAEMKPKKVYL